MIMVELCIETQTHVCAHALAQRPWSGPTSKVCSCELKCVANVWIKHVVGKARERSGFCQLGNIFELCTLFGSSDLVRSSRNQVLLAKGLCG